MKKIIVGLTLAGIVTLPLLTGCRTTEANYRAAYEKAIETRDRNAVDSTVYGRFRQEMRQTVVVSGNDTVPVSVRHVSVTEGGGGIREYIRPYNIVVGEFKQIFNARSLRERLVAGGYPRTFVVNTREPYYFVIIGGYDKIGEARAALDSLRRNPPVVMRDPCPFILQDPRVRR